MRPAAVADNPGMISAPLSSLQAWCEHFRQAPIPALAGTVEELETLRLVNEASDSVDAHMISEAVSSDPLMILRVLAYASTHRRPGQVTDAETVTAAVLLMGITRFFNEFSDVSSVNAVLNPVPGAMDGLRRVVRRARRAAHFSQAIAIHRADADIAVICEAALLHDFAEMLLWCHAPVLALEIARRQAEDTQLRSHTIQKELLGITLADLEQALMQAWHLPALLIRITNDAHAEDPQVANVALAVRIARHSQEGWDNPALPDDFAALGSLLRVLPSSAQDLMQQVDA